MNNSIPRRIYDFLKVHPPFSRLEKDKLMEIAKTVTVQYVPRKEVLFKEGETPEPFIFVVREGAIHLTRKEMGAGGLTDVCDEGDLFGFRPLLSQQKHDLTAIAEEESLLYGIPIDNLQQFLERYPEIAAYLTDSHVHPGRDPFQLVEIQSIRHSRSPVTCGPDTKVREAAKIMKDQQVGSIIIVNDQSHPLGILTDRDLRNRVVTGEFPLDSPVSALMSSPVITLTPDRTIADVQISMLRHRIHHLCLTPSGKPDSPVIGVISEHDLLVVQGNNPAVLMREMKRSKTAADLKQVREKAEELLRKYLLQEVSINFICNMITEINDELIARAIQLCQEEMQAEAPEVNWCWLALGSEGRGEQLLRTDQDNALIFADVPKADQEAVKQYFLALAKKATAMLNECGFDYCPGEMMASNPQWCLSLGEWKKQFSRWILQPVPKNIMFCNIFFDYRPIYGERLLSDQLTQHIYTVMESQSVFLSLLAKDAVKSPPPLTFFRNFMVEKSGEHRDKFDIKGRAMQPLADAARVLILNEKEPGITNTLHRFDHLAAKDPPNRELFEQAAEAYGMLVRYRALQGLSHHDEGRYFNPAELSKMQRLNLRNSFRPIGEIQELLQVRFRLSLML